jgi:hypothetical protein
MLKNLIFLALLKTPTSKQNSSFKNDLTSTLYFSLKARLVQFAAAITEPPVTLME